MKPKKRLVPSFMKIEPAIEEWQEFPYIKGGTRGEIAIGFMPEKDLFFLRTKKGEVLGESLSKIFQSKVNLENIGAFDYLFLRLVYLRRVFASIAPRNFRYTVLIPKTPSEADYKSLSPCFDLLLEQRYFLNIH